MILCMAKEVRDNGLTSLIRRTTGLREGETESSILSASRVIRPRACMLALCRPLPRRLLLNLCLAER